MDTPFGDIGELYYNIKEIKIIMRGLGFGPRNSLRDRMSSVRPLKSCAFDQTLLPPQVDLSYLKCFKNFAIIRMKNYA